MRQIIARNYNKFTLRGWNEGFIFNSILFLVYLCAYIILFLHKINELKKDVFTHTENI